MGTRALLQLPRTLMQPIRSLSQFQPAGGSNGRANQRLTSFLVRREFVLCQVLANSQSTNTVTPPKRKDDATDSSTTSKKMEEELKERMNAKEVRSVEFKSTDNPADLKHFMKPPTVPAQDFTDPTMVRRDPDSLDTTMGKYAMPHPIWSEEDVHEVVITHKKPTGIIDTLAYYSVWTLRGSYDIMSGYRRRTRNEILWLNRIIMLETVAGVPGMVAAMVRHLQSLRKMSRDHGWIHTLLEEAENERMHLMVAMQLKQPGVLFRTLVMGAQGVFVSLFSLAYLISPRYCHRFVGYLEEEAVVTYTKCLRDIDEGNLKHWKTQTAPGVAIRYWSLLPTATMRDVILAIRADEAHHRVVNHKLASMKQGEFNPYKPGE